MKIRRVGGVQAEMAKKDLDLIKITKDSARALFNAGTHIVVVGSKVNSFHFFKGWHLAMRVDPAPYLERGGGGPKGDISPFDLMANSWANYNEHPETGKMAFFVDKKDV